MPTKYLSIATLMRILPTSHTAMKKILFLILSLPSLSWCQATITQIRTKVNAYYATNNSKQITAAKSREIFQGILDNLVQPSRDTIQGTNPRILYLWPSTTSFSTGIYGSSASTSRFSIYNHYDNSEQFSVYYNQGYNRSNTPLLTSSLIAGANSYVTPPNTIHASSANANSQTYLSAGESDLVRLKIGWAGALASAPANNVVAAQIIALDATLAIASRSSVPSSIAFYTNDTENQSVRRFDISRYGHLVPFLNNTYDIGTGSNAVRYGYFGTGITIGGSSIAASAMLDISSTTKGVLLPRMTTTQVNAISSPAAGLMVYNTTLNKLCFYNGSSWRQLTDSAM